MSLLPRAAWPRAHHPLAHPTQAAEEGQSSKHAAHRLEKRAPWPSYLESVNERAISASQKQLHTLNSRDAGSNVAALASATISLLRTSEVSTRFRAPVDMR